MKIAGGYQVAERTTGTAGRAVGSRRGRRRDPVHIQGMSAADDEETEAGRRYLAARRAARARRDAALLTVLEGLDLEQFAQYAGHGSGPLWVAAGMFLVRVVLRWWPWPPHP